MVVIRLSRGGAKKRPFYRLCVADSRKASTGKFIELIGFFNPCARGQEEHLRINYELLNAWLAKGARLSPRVAQLLKAAKVNSAKAINA